MATVSVPAEGARGGLLRRPTATTGWWSWDHHRRPQADRDRRIVRTVVSETWMSSFSNSPRIRW
jgi:hypothetical protein